MLQLILCLEIKNFQLNRVKKQYHINFSKNFLPAEHCCFKSCKNKFETNFIVNLVQNTISDDTLNIFNTT